MAGPTPSWGTVPVFGTWLLLDGTPVAGKVRFTLPQRITNAPGDVIFPRNGVLEFALGAETGSINFDCPVLDDPDNFPDDASVQILVEEIFVNAVNASYYIRPVAAMSGNTPPGLDLRTVVVVSDTPAAPPPSLIRGVAGGVAALDTSGNVLDGAGHPVVGGVASVNGHAGTVVLAASDVGADATGAAAAAQAAAATYTNGQVAGEASARATAITALVNSAPGALDTLKELADALGDDANFAATITNALALKAPLASPALTGSPTINGHTPVTADQAGTVFDAARPAELQILPSADATGATDLAAVNTALSSMSTFGGGIVRLSGGDWYVNASIQPRSKTRLVGHGAGTRLHMVGSGVIIAASATGFTDFALESLHFYGTVNEFPTAPKRARTTGGAGAITAVSISGDLDTTGSGQAQITDFTMRDCTVRNCSQLPIRVGGVRGRVLVTGCQFVNNQDVGFLFNQEVIFMSNHVQQSADNGVSLSRGNTKVTCVGNTFENIAYDGIFVSGFNTDVGPTNFTISGNVIKSCGMNGIRADLGASYGVINGNSIDLGYYRGPSDQASDVNGAGVYVGGYPGTDRTTPTTLASDVTVVGNQIRRAARAGVYLNGVQRVVVAANQISDVGTQYLADGSTAIASSDATQNVGILLENPTTSNGVTVGLNTVIDSRGTPFTNFGLVPQATSGIEAYLNNMVGCRNAFNMLETGPTRTNQSGMQFNLITALVGGARTGASASTGTVAGYDLNGAAGSTRPVRWMTALVERWHLRANSTAESGSDVGSDLELVSRTDAGALKHTLMQWIRGTGVTQFGRGSAQQRVAQTLGSNGAVTVDASTGNVQTVILAANATSTSITNPTTGQILVLTFKQDGTGSRNYVWPTATYAAGAAPANLSAANSIDTVTLHYDGTAWNEVARSQQPKIPTPPGFGFPYTVNPNYVRATDSLGVGTANRCIYLRCIEGGTISSVEIDVAVQSGNISVAAYSNSGTGRAGVPGTRLATSGAVACPAVGASAVSLGGSITMNPGDWLAISADNTTATFRCLLASAATDALGTGFQFIQASAHPAPSTPSGLTAAIGNDIVLIGV